MHADNTTTDHNRTIRITDIPYNLAAGIIPELTITINYANDSLPVIDKAITLDNIIIPTIISLINNQQDK
jgi:hypothetical protein